MNIDEITEMQRLQLIHRMAELKQAALSYSINPNENERQNFLFCTAHEFAKTLHEIGLNEYWTITEMLPEPCNDEQQP